VTSVSPKEAVKLALRVPVSDLTGLFCSIEASLVLSWEGVLLENPQITIYLNCIIFVEFLRYRLALINTDFV